MRIGAIQKQSFIDWPGRIAAVIFTKGCNFRCGYCHNPYLVVPRLLDATPDIPVNHTIAFLRSRANWLDGVVVSGGEPTVHPDLVDFISEIRGAGYSVKLDTNGSNPEVIKELIDFGLIDAVAMDVKTLLDEEEYRSVTNCPEPDLVAKIKSSIAILQKSGTDYQLRTTCIPGVHSQRTINGLKKVFEGLKYTCTDFRPTDTVSNYM